MHQHELLQLCLFKATNKKCQKGQPYIYIFAQGATIWSQNSSRFVNNPPKALYSWWDYWTNDCHFFIFIFLHASLISKMKRLLKYENSRATEKNLEVLDKSCVLTIRLSYDHFESGIFCRIFWSSVQAVKHRWVLFSLAWINKVMDLYVRVSIWCIVSSLLAFRVLITNVWPNRFKIHLYDCLK